jgi:hypothetical protein
MSQVQAGGKYLHDIQQHGDGVYEIQRDAYRRIPVGRGQIDDATTFSLRQQHPRPSSPPFSSHLKQYAIIESIIVKGNVMNTPQSSPSSVRRKRLVGKSLLLFSREPGTEENPCASCPREESKKQDNPQQAAVAELPCKIISINYNSTDDVE